MKKLYYSNIFFFTFIVLCTLQSSVFAQINNSFSTVVINQAGYTTITDNRNIELIEQRVPTTELHTENCVSSSEILRLNLYVNGNLYNNVNYSLSENPTAFNYFETLERYRLSAVFIPAHEPALYITHFVSNTLIGFDNENFTNTRVKIYNDFAFEERYLNSEHVGDKNTYTGGNLNIDMSRIGLSAGNYLVYIRLVNFSANEAESDTAINTKDAAAISLPFVIKVQTNTIGSNQTVRIDRCDGNAPVLMSSYSVTQWLKDKQRVATSQQYTPTASGTYQAIAQTVDECVLSDIEYIVNFVPIPSKPSISFPASNIYTHCSNTLNITLDSATTFGNNQWFYFTNDIAEDVPNLSTSIGGTYYIYNENSICSSTAASVTIIFNNINETPIISPPTSPVCKNDSFTLNITNPGTHLVNVYRNSTLFFSNQNVLSIPPLTGGYTYSIQFVNKDCSSAESNRIRVDNFSVPNIVFDLSEIENSCEGSDVSIRLKNALYPADWYVNGALVAQALSSIQINQSASLQARYVNTPCPTQTSTVQAVVLGSMPLTPTFSKKEYTECEGNTIDLMPTFVQRDTGIRWYKNGQLLSETTERLSVTESGDYQMELFEKGCNTQSDILKVLFLKRPPIPVFTENTKNVLCLNNETNTVSVQNYSYVTWYIDGVERPEFRDQYQIEAQQAGVYKVVFYSNMNNCLQTGTERSLMFENEDFFISAGGDKFIFRGEPTKITGSVSNNLKDYFWTPAQVFLDSRSLMTVANISQTEIIHLSAYTSNGCIHSNTAHLILLANQDEINNVITPNNDDKNERWRPDKEYAELSNCEYNIFDISGKFIVRNACDIYWDISLESNYIEEGIYFYKIILDKNILDSRIVFGEIYIIR